MTLGRLGWALGAVVCAGVLAMVVLTAGAGGTTAGPAPAGKPAPTGSGPPRSPTDEEKDVLHQAEQLLIRDCMAEQGFRYWPAPRLPSPDYREFPYVVDDAEWAAKHGYGRELEDRQKRRWDEKGVRKYLNGLSAARKTAYTEALHGPESDTPLKAEVAMGGAFTHSDRGCTVEAWRGLYGDVRAWYRSIQMVNSLPGVRAGRVVGEADFRTGLAAWRSCMRQRGHTAENPSELRRVRFLDTGRGARAKDVAAATAEARCARTSGLAATAERLDEHYRDVEYRAHRSAFDTARRLQLEALPTARDVVGRG